MYFIFFFTLGTPEAPSILTHTFRSPYVPFTLISAGHIEAHLSKTVRFFFA
jgi:hypothetical protein